MRFRLFYLICLLLPGLSFGQTDQRINQLKTTELVLSMSQRSIVMPGYLTELKGLIARQAFEFWSKREAEPYVSHLNVYAALYEANKYIGYDSSRMLAYNQQLGHERTVTSIKMSDDGQSYYSASSDGSVLKWNLNDPSAIPEIVFDSDEIVRSIDISADGKWMMMVFYKTGLQLISLNPGSEDDILSVRDPEPVQMAVFIPENQQYLSVTKDGKLVIKGFKQEPEQVGQTASHVLALEVAEIDGTIYAGTLEGVIESWENQTYFGYDLGSPAITCMDISPDGSMLAIGRDRGDVVLWSIKEKKLERLISGHSSTVTDIQFSPNNNLLLTTSRDKTARIWDLNDFRKLPIVLDDHEDWVMTGCFDPTGSSVLTGSRDKYIRTWSVTLNSMADRLCKHLSRNMTEAEWQEFVGIEFPYQNTCPNLD